MLWDQDLLESVYEYALAYELRQSEDFDVNLQVPLPELLMMGKLISD